MSGRAALREQDAFSYAVLALASLALVFSLGPLVVLIALLTALALAFFDARPAHAAGVAAAASILGILLNKNLTLWLTAPISQTHEFYSHALPDSLLSFLLTAGELTRFMAALGEESLAWLQTPSLWLAYAPAGLFCGSGAYALYRLYFKNPLVSLTREKPMEKIHGKVGDLPSAMVNQRAADTAEGALIGTDRYARVVELTDRAANQHTLVLGTTGSGKTVTICNIVESAINRALPLIYIDGKGDYDLACRIARFGQDKGRPVSLFAMKGESIAYNPLSTGGFTSKKDRIIELREWSEEHYKKLAEGYLQSVFKVMDACGIPCNLASLAFTP